MVAKLTGEARRDGRLAQRRAECDVRREARREVPGVFEEELRGSASEQFEQRLFAAGEADLPGGDVGTGGASLGATHRERGEVVRRVGFE